MDTMDVTMPDGVVVKGVPVGTPKDQIMAKYKGQSNTPTVPNQEPQQPQKGFMQRIGQDVQNRRGKAQAIKSSNDTIPEKILQVAGNAEAGLIGDVVGEGAKSAYQDLPEKARAAIESNPVIKFGVSMAQKGAATYNKWAEQNPRAARDVEAVVNIANLFPTAELSAAKEATLIPSAVRTAKSVSASGEKAMGATTQALHKAATSTAEDLKASGIQYHPSVGEDLSTLPNKIDIDVEDPTEIPRHKETLEALSNLNKQNEKNGVTMRSIFNTRKTLGEIAAKGGEDGTSASKAISKLDDIVSKAHANKLASGDTNYIGKFNSQWKAFKSHEAVEAATALADESSAQSRKAFLKIVDSPYFRSLSPTIQGLVKTASKGTKGGKFLDAVGKIKHLLGVNVKTGAAAPIIETVGAALTGHPGVAAGVAGTAAVSSAASKIGKLKQRGLGGKISKAIREEQ